MTIFIIIISLIFLIGIVIYLKLRKKKNDVFKCFLISDVDYLVCLYYVLDKNMPYITEKR